MQTWCVPSLAKTGTSTTVLLRRQSSNQWNLLVTGGGGWPLLGRRLMLEQGFVCRLQTAQARAEASEGSIHGRFFVQSRAAADPLCGWHLISDFADDDAWRSRTAPVLTKKQAPRLFKDHSAGN